MKYSHNIKAAADDNRVEVEINQEQAKAFVEGEFNFVVKTNSGREFVFFVKDVEAMATLVLEEPSISEN